MRGGDISNESPASVIVNLDVILTTTVEVTKVLGLLPRTGTARGIDILAANAVWRVASQSSLTWEAFTCDLDEAQADWVSGELDRLGINPFRWIIVAASIPALMAEMPYRRNVFGIVDRPERALMYGPLYIDLGTIYGGD